MSSRQTPYTDLLRAKVDPGDWGTYRHESGPRLEARRIRISQIVQKIKATKGLNNEIYRRVTTPKKSKNHKELQERLNDMLPHLGDSMEDVDFTNTVFQNIDIPQPPPSPQPSLSSASEQYPPSYPLDYESNGINYIVHEEPWYDNLFQFVFNGDCKIEYEINKEKSEEISIFINSFYCNQDNGRGRGMGRTILLALLNYLTDPHQTKLYEGDFYNCNDDTVVSLKADASWSSKGQWWKIGEIGEKEEAQAKLVEYYIKIGFHPAEEGLPIPLEMNGIIGEIKHKIEEYGGSKGGRRKRTRRKSRKTRKSRKSRRRR